MRECHKCPLNGTGSAECIECAKEHSASSRPSNDGMSVTSLDELPEIAAPEPDVPSDGDASESLAMFAHAVAALLSLPTEQFRVVSLRFTDCRMTPHSFADIGRAMGKSRQWAQQELEAALTQWPILRTLFAMKGQEPCQRY